MQQSGVFGKPSLSSRHAAVFVAPLLWWQARLSLMREHGRKIVFHSVPGRGQYTVTYSPGCQALLFFILVQFDTVGLGSGLGCQGIVALWLHPHLVVVLSSCFMVRGRCFTTSMTGMSLRLKHEGGHSREGTLEWMAPSFCAILLTFCCPYQKCKEKKADPVKRERTAGGAQLWLHVWVRGLHGLWTLYASHSYSWQLGG